jgi:hypothetical protein
MRYRWRLKILSALRQLRFRDEAPLIMGHHFPKWFVLMLVLATALCGCGVQSAVDSAKTGAAPASTTAEIAGNAIADQDAAEGGGGEMGADPQTAPPAERKIIYTAVVDLVVDDFTETDRKIQALTKEFGGFIAEFREDRTYGDRRSGRWVVRTPVRRFQEFLDQVVALGVPETRQMDAQDVTEEYVDLEARLASKKRLEERILQLLEERAGEIKDVIVVEQELARVREEIERMEGRLRFLANRVELTTITITAREEVDYEPPQAPTFTGKVQSTWSQSLTALGRTLEALALTVVALFPWFVLLLLIGTPFAMGLARWWRRRTPQSAEVIDPGASSISS